MNRLSRNEEKGRLQAKLLFSKSLLRQRVFLSPDFLCSFFNHSSVRLTRFTGKIALWAVCNSSTHLVTLNIRNSRTHRSTDTPSGSIHSFLVRMISMIEPMTTKQSKRLKSETKYPWKPRLYILRNISKVKRTTKNILALSVERKASIRLLFDDSSTDSNTLKSFQGRRLSVVLWGQRNGIQKYKNYYGPVEGFRFTYFSATSAASPVPDPETFL